MALVFSASTAFAQSQAPGTPVATIGVQGNLAYFSFSGADSACNWYLYYIDITTTAGKAMYSSLLASKISGLNLTRVDYTNSGGTCTVSLVQI